MITTFPPLPALPTYEAAVARRDEIATDLRQSNRELDDLPRLHAEAVKADEDRHAAAILAGKAAPKNRPATEKFQEEADALRHRVQALRTALTQAEQAVVAIVVEQREEIALAAATEVQAAADDYLQAVAVVEAARDRYFAARRAQGWAEDPTRNRFREQPSPALNVPGVNRANGEPGLPFVSMIATMKAETEGLTSPPVEAFFTSGRSQQTHPIPAKSKKVVVEDPLGAQGDQVILMVPPGQDLNEAKHRAEVEAGKWERDQAENLAAYQAAVDQGLADPLADLR